MIGGIIAILIAFGFYRGAEQRRLPGFQWAFGGLITYYIPNISWSLLVAKPWLAQLHKQTPSFMTTLVGFSSVLIGLTATALVYLLVLSRKPLPPEN